MSNPQKQADEVRNMVQEHEAIGRVGLEVLWASGAPSELVLRARHHDRVITIERGPGWTAAEPVALALELASELITEALGTERPAVPPALWRRGATHLPPTS